jgi:tetratricopeptide (TPR) repeat protein
MHVESVAWISERKDLLYTLFFLSSLIFWLKYIKSQYKTPKYLLFAFLLFVFSLMSKSAAVVMSPTILLCSYFINKKISKKDILLSLPFFILSLIFGIIALKTQENAMSDLGTHYNLLNRILVVFYSLYFYVVRFVFPYDFSALHVYPIPNNDVLPLLFYIAPIVVVAIIIYIIKTKNEIKHVLVFGFLFFLINIILVLQIISIGQAIVSERYTYVSYIGLSFIFASVVIAFMDKYKSKILLYSTILFFIFLAMSTWQQNKVWNDSITLWTKALEVNPQIATAYNNRGIAKSKRGDKRGAILDYNMGLKYKSDDATTYYNRGKLKAELKDYLGAIKDYDFAIKYNPNEYKSYYNRANSKSEIGDIEGAIIDYNRAVEIDTKSAEAYNNRGLAKSAKGDYIGAIDDYNIALKYNKDDAEIYNNRGVAFVLTNQYGLAIKDFTDAINHNDRYSEAYINMALVQMSMNETKNACTNFINAYNLGDLSVVKFINSYCK